MSGTTDRVIRNGHVAVLISPGFGAGWSTWNTDVAEQCLFDPAVVDWVENGKQGLPPLDHYNDDYFSSGGASDLIVMWVKAGSRFIVNEYDGSESLTLEEDIPFFTA